MPSLKGPLDAHFPLSLLDENVKLGKKFKQLLMLYGAIKHREMNVTVKGPDFEVELPNSVLKSLKENAEKELFRFLEEHSQYRPDHLSLYYELKRRFEVRDQIHDDGEGSGNTI